MGLSSFKFSWWLVSSIKPSVVQRKCIVAVQGHPQSLVLVPIESAYRTSWGNSNWTCLAPFRRLQDFCENCLFSILEKTPANIDLKFGVFPLEDWIAGVEAPKSEDSRLIIRVITSVLNVTGGQTDGRTDRQPITVMPTALCTYVHCAVKRIGLSKMIKPRIFLF